MAIAAAAMASITVATSTSVSCANCDAIQCTGVAAEVSSLDQVCSMIPCVVPGNKDSQPDYLVLSEIPFLLTSAKIKVLVACNTEL